MCSPSSSIQVMIAPLVQVNLESPLQPESNEAESQHWQWPVPVLGDGSTRVRDHSQGAVRKGRVYQPSCGPKGAPGTWFHHPTFKKPQMETIH